MNITKAINFNRKQQSINAKNVLQPTHTIPITVRKFFTDVDGVIINKSLAPAALQTRYPVFLLGEFDRQGGYSVGRKSVPPSPGTYYLQSFVNGMGNTSYSITGQNGLNNIQARLQAGDIVIVYTDNINAPTYYVWLQISSIPVSMAAILANSATTQKDKRMGKLFVYAINFQPDTESQLSEDFHFTRTDNLGNFDDNTVQPLGIYRSIMDKQRNLITLKTEFNINQFIGINSYMLFACDAMRLEMKIVKI